MFLPTDPRTLLDEHARRVRRSEWRRRMLDVSPDTNADARFRALRTRPRPDGVAIRSRAPSPPYLAAARASDPVPATR